MSPRAPITWRTPLLYRIFFPAVGLFFLVAAVAFVDGGADPAFTVLAPLLGLALALGPFRPMVRLDADAVHARGLLFSRRMPLLDIVDVAGGYSGLVFRLRDGRTFEATGVGEKLNVTTWTGRRGKADAIVDTILAARDEAAAAPSAAPLPTTPPRPLPTWVMVTQAVAMVVFLVGAYLAFVSDVATVAGRPLMLLGALAPMAALAWAARHGSRGEGGS